MSTETFDTNRLKPENVSDLSEPQQQQLLADIKAEVTRIETRTKSAQKSVIRKMRQQIAHHEAQATWFAGEMQKCEDLLSSRSPDEDTPDQAQARALLENTRTFYRAGRKMLTIQLQDLREDFAKVAAEPVTAFEVGDPFNTYEWRKASAQCDLAAIQVMMGGFELGHVLLASALGVPRFPDNDLLPMASGPLTSPLAAARGSRELTRTGARSGKLASSSLGLEEHLPPPIEVPDLATPPDEPQGDDSDAAPIESTAGNNQPADEPSPEQQGVVDQIRNRFKASPQLVERCKSICTLLADSNGLIRLGREQFGQISTLPPKDGAQLLQLPLWNKINGKVFALQRLGAQCADDTLLAILFPKSEIPELPFMRQGEDSQMQKLADSPTNSLGLAD